MPYPSKRAFIGVLAWFLKDESPCQSKDFMITITNFGKVTDRIYRGAQPSYAQFGELLYIGIAHVLDLREDFGREAEAAACSKMHIAYVNVPIGNQKIPVLGELGVLPPTHQQVVLILDLLNSAPTTTAWYVHCAHEEDRTGAVIAAYRMVVQQWTNQQAMEEAEAYDINPLQILIREWIEKFKASDYV